MHIVHLLPLLPKTKYWIEFISKNIRNSCLLWCRIRRAMGARIGMLEMKVFSPSFGSDVSALLVKCFMELQPPSVDLIWPSENERNTETGFLNLKFAFKFNNYFFSLFPMIVYYGFLPLFFFFKTSNIWHGNLWHQNKPVFADIRGTANFAIRT